MAYPKCAVQTLGETRPFDRRQYYTLCAAKDGSYIDARFDITTEVYSGAPYDTTWTMGFYRKQPDGSWKLGDTKTGYCTYSSKSQRTVGPCKPGLWAVKIDVQLWYAGVPASKFTLTAYITI